MVPKWIAAKFYGGFTFGHPYIHLEGFILINHQQAHGTRAARRRAVPILSPPRAARTAAMWAARQNDGRKCRHGRAGRTAPPPRACAPGGTAASRRRHRSLPRPATGRAAAPRRPAATAPARPTWRPRAPLRRSPAPVPTPATARARRAG